MSLLLLFNQPAATPTTVVSGSVLQSRQPKPRIQYRRDNIVRDDELILMLLAKYLEVEESDYE